MTLTYISVMLYGCDDKKEELKIIIDYVVQLQLPTITICNRNMFSRSKVKKEADSHYIEKLLTNMFIPARYLEPEMAVK